MTVDLNIYHIYPDPLAMAGEGAKIYYNLPAAADLATAIAGRYIDSI
jgi:hypothetical protein